MTQEELQGVRQEPKNQLSFLIAKHLATEKINPTDTAILNKIDTLDLNDIYLILNMKGAIDD